MSGWQVFSDTAGGGSVSQSANHPGEGSESALVSSSGAGDIAQIRADFIDRASDHTWDERLGTWHWQQACIYVPGATIDKLGPNDYITVAGFWTSTATYGWFLRIRQGGQMYVVGNRWSDGAQHEFRIYGRFPQDRWVDLEIGLNSQYGPGVKRSFAFLVDGDFYGWYHQGRMLDETYDRAAMGILDTNSSQNLDIYLDLWRMPLTTSLPGGPDNRPTTDLQEQDFRNQSGVQWHIDWDTWENDVRLDPQYGMYSNIGRVQASRNIERMPVLTSGWAEIEIDWPNGTPPSAPLGKFGPLIAIRRDINREESFLILPYGDGSGGVNLMLKAWLNTTSIDLASWPMPAASIGGGNIPEPGDILRVRWEQLNSTDLNVRASYYDASAATWYMDVINYTTNVTNIGGVDYTDGYHVLSSSAIDTPYYSIRRYKVGTLPTYP